MITLLTKNSLYLLLKRGLIITSLLTFLFLCLLFYNVTGLHYDETLFINGVFGNLPNAMVYKKINDIPLFITPYLGALKSYLYFIWFKFFDVNVLTIRLPVVFISMLTIWLWYKTFIQHTQKYLFGLFFLFLLATDPTFMAHTRYDFGPIVLQNAISAICFYLLFYFMEKKSFSAFFSFLFFLLLGLFNKLNFIWFIITLLPMSFIFFRKKMLFLFNDYCLKTIIVFSIFLIALYFFCIKLILPAGTHFAMGAFRSDFYSKIIYIIDMYLKTMNGSEPFFYIFGTAIPIHSMTNVMELSVLGAWIITVFYAYKNKINEAHYFNLNKIILFYLSMLITLLLFVCLTPQSWGSHHLMIIWPLHHLIFILMLNAIGMIFLKNKINFYCIFLFPFLLILSQLFTSYEYLSAIKNLKAYKKHNWSPAIFSLINYTNQHSLEYDAIAAIDFGINNQLITLAKPYHEKQKYYDIWYFLTDNPQIIKARNFFFPNLNQSQNAVIASLYESLFKNKKTLVILYSHYEIMPNVRYRFFEFTKNYHLTMTPITIINDHDGNDIYRLYAVTTLKKE